MTAKDDRIRHAIRQCGGRATLRQITDALQAGPAKAEYQRVYEAVRSMERFKMVRRAGTVRRHGCRPEVLWEVIE